MKNGFKPGVYEKYGLYMGNGEHDRKQGEVTISYYTEVGQPIEDMLLISKFLDYFEMDLKT